MRLLLLAGTSEAFQIAQAVGQDTRVSAIGSVARASRAPRGMSLPMRIGGFGGDEAFANWLDKESVDAVLDATHPFATRISERTHRICAEKGVDYVHFLRPAWIPSDGDRWVFLNGDEDAAAHVPGDATVLLNTGWRRVEAFRALDGRPVYLRVRDRFSEPPPFRPGGLVMRPYRPSVPEEMAGLRRLGIEWIVTRNSGGTDSAPLLEAARRLAMPVAMVRRPPQPQTSRIRSVAEALAWVRRRL